MPGKSVGEVVHFFAAARGQRLQRRGADAAVDATHRGIGEDEIHSAPVRREEIIRLGEWIVQRTPADPCSLRFPLIVKPRHESTSFGLRLVHSRAELEDAVVAITSTYLQDALVEEYIEGREFCVALLGNDPVQCLPVVEQDFGDRDSHLLTKADKYHKVNQEPVKRCPAPISACLRQRLFEISIATFQACHLRDYARVDIRLNKEGDPFVLEINSMASLGPGGSYVCAAAAAGLDYDALVRRIVDEAHTRYFGVPAPVEADVPFEAADMEVSGVPA